MRCHGVQSSSEQAGGICEVRVTGPRGPAEIARLLTEDFITMKTNTQLMLVSRWQPFSWRPLREFQEEMNRVSGRFGVENGLALADSYPPVNIWGDSDSVYAEAELPGMQLDYLEIYVTEGNQLTIQGERRQRELDNGVWYGQERGFGHFSRTVMLPVNVDADK